MPKFSDIISETVEPKQPSTFDQLVGEAPSVGLRKPEAPEQNEGVMGDIGTALKRGALELPGMVTGLVDIPLALTTGTRPISTVAEKLGDVTGFRPGKWAEEAAQEYSPELQATREKIAKVWEDPEKSAFDVAKAYATSPAYIGSLVAESVPSMVASGVVARGLMTAGRAAGAGIGFLERKLGEKTAAAIAGGAGEGIVQAGQAMAGFKGEDQRRGAIAAIGSGVVDAVIGAGAGRLAQSFGFDTAETIMAKGFNKAVTQELSLTKSLAAKAGRAAGGALSEGILQELPQSAQETIWANYAEGTPLWDGVPRAAVEGALAGFAMGAGANLVPTRGMDTGRDRISEQVIRNVYPDAEVKVVDGVASVVKDVDGGQQTFTAPVDDMSKAILSGGGIEDVGVADTVVTQPPSEDIGAPEVVTTKEGRQRIFERLPDEIEAPDTLIYNIRGKEYRYAPPVGETREFLDEGIKGKSHSAAVNWLKKNAVLEAQSETKVAEPSEVSLPVEEATPTREQEDIVAAVAPPVSEESPEVLPEVSPEPEVSIPAQITNALGKPDQMKAFEDMGVTAESDQIIQIVRDAVNQKVMISQMFRDRGKEALADSQLKEAIQAAETIKSFGDPVANKAVDDAFDGVPLVGLDKETFVSGKDAPADAPISAAVFTKETPTEEAAPGTEPFVGKPSHVLEEGRAFLGRGFDNLIAKGKIEIIEDQRSLDGLLAKAKYPKGSRIAAAYIPKDKKVYLVSGNMSRGSVEGYMRHEIAHALLREDTKFVNQKNKILNDFGLLAGSDESVRDAFTKASRLNVPQKMRLEEALTYWLQNIENHNHSLFKRIISAIKQALAKIGIPTTQLSTTDLSRLFAQGTAEWAQDYDLPEEAKSPEVMFAFTDNVLAEGKQRMRQANNALKSSKSKAYNLFIQHAPKWLAVTPLATLEQTYGKDIPQIKKFAERLSNIVATKTEIVDTAAVKHDTAEKIARKGVGVDTLNRAAGYASYYQMNPWKPVEQQDWVPETGTKSDRLKKAQDSWKLSGMQKATGKTFKEAYNESKNSFTALKTKELKDAYLDMVAHLQSIRQRERNNLLAYIELVSEEGTDLRRSLMDQFTASFSNLRGAYWPLERIGDFILEYQDAEGVRNVNHFTSINERQAAKDTFIKQGADPNSFKEDVKDRQPQGAVALPQMLFNQLSNAVEEKYVSQVPATDQQAVADAQERARQTVNDMNQIWLRWLPETSALKNSIERKSVKGFSEDMLRSYLSYTQRHASNIAWAEHGRKIEDNLSSLSDDISERKKLGEDVTMRRHILNDLRSRIQALRTVNVGPVASFLGKLGTGYYMTSPSIALVQMTQLPILTLPRLATLFSAKKASVALSKGIKEAFSKRFTRDAMFSDPEVNYVYENLRATVTEENRGMPGTDGKNIGDRIFSDKEMLDQIKKLDPYQQQLLVLRESMARNLLDISAAHEAYELTRGKDPKNIRSRIFNLAMLPMSLSELTSRKAAILATNELSKGEGKNFFQTMEDIAGVVNDTLYSYAKEHKGAAMQGGISRVILQFQHYRIMTALRMAMLFKNAIKGESQEVRRAATKEFVGIMGMTGALAGTMGLPIANIIFGVLGLALGDDDEPEDYKLMYTNWLRENFGESASRVIEKGLPAAAGLDISRRIGLADIYGFQNEPPTGLHGRNLAAWWAASQLGPIFSVGQGWFQGYDEMVNKGNYMKGLEVATPKPVRDILKSIRVGTEGLKTSQGKRLLSEEDVGADEVIMMALGFNPEEISKAYASERSLRTLSTKISERRGRLIRDAARTIVEGGDTSKVFKNIREFNRKMPRFAVLGGDVKPAVRNLIRGELGATGEREVGVAEQYGVPVYRGR